MKAGSSVKKSFSEAFNERPACRAGKLRLDQANYAQSSAQVVTDREKRELRLEGLQTTPSRGTDLILWLLG